MLKNKNSTIENNSEKEYIYIYTHIHSFTCITESVCCTPKTNTTLYINYNSVKKNPQNTENKGECKSQQCAGAQEEVGCPDHPVPLSLHH